MRVAFAMINCNRRDGSARAVNEVAERLARRGHEVHLFARRAEDLDKHLVRWHRIPGPGWPEVADFWTYFVQVNHRLGRSDFEIVHSIGCNTLRANVITIQNIQPVKMRILAGLGETARVSLPRQFTRWLYLQVTCRAEKRLYTASPHRKPKMFLPVSRGVEAELRTSYEIGEASVRIVPNAADTDVFRISEPAARERWRASVGVERDDFFVIFSGGEWSRKGLDLAIRAIGKIEDPRVRLFVAGDDPARARFEALAADVGRRVIFGGFRKDVAEAMGAADLFLFPSYYEAFSLATIEAAACGLPVVASRINGTEDFIRPGDTGEFVEHDSDKIAAVVNRFAQDRSMARRMGANGRRLVEQHYTWDRVTDLTEAAYREVLEK